jgi:predicted nucleic acid-binding protein
LPAGAGRCPSGPDFRGVVLGRHESDDKVLQTAVAGQADIILTGDRDLLLLGEHDGIRILSPRQFVELMDRRG